MKIGLPLHTPVGYKGVYFIRTCFPDEAPDKSNPISI